MLNLPNRSIPHNDKAALMTALGTPLVGPTALRSVATRSVPKRPPTLLLFQIGEQGYALPLSEVQEVISLPQLSCPPTLPSVLAGFLNLSGVAIPVLRLDRLFDRPESPSSRYTPLILLRNPDYRLALMVEKVTRMVTVGANNLVPIRSNESFNDCVEALITIDNRVILVLSAQRLLLEKEHQCLAEFQDREQSRLRALEAPIP